MTIKDIARLSGCGVATVSRVLNGHPDVSAQTRQRVLAVVEEQGFQPNANAKHLKQRAGAGVAVVVKGTQNMLFAPLVEGLQARLQARGVDETVYYLDEDGDEAAFALRLCRERKPLGLLFLGGTPERFGAGFVQSRTPGVLLTASARGLALPNLSSLAADDALAARQVTEYLLARGHREIGVVGGSPAASPVSALRLEGCRAALAGYGLDFDPELRFESCRFSMADAYAAAGRLLERCPDLTAIFAMSDVMAVGVIRALADRGKSVPGDVSVAGCDGIPLSRFCVPRLTTVLQDVDRLAREGVELLLDGLLEGMPPVHRLLPVRIVEGESVAGIPAKGTVQGQEGSV